MLSEHKTTSEQGVRLKDVTEEGALPKRIQPRRGRKKIVMAGALCALLTVMVMAGYFLLRGKDVQVNASRWATDKITSGSDLQKAAYDSLGASLKGPAPFAPPSAPATNIGSGQRTDVTMAGVAPSPASAVENESAPKIPAPIQPGIAMTLAPPPEASLSKESKSTGLGQAATGSDQPESSASGAYGASKPKTDASIPFSLPSVAISLVEKDKLKSVATDATKAPIPAGGKPVLEKARSPKLRRDVTSAIDGRALHIAPGIALTARTRARRQERALDAQTRHGLRRLPARIGTRPRFRSNKGIYRSRNECLHQTRRRTFGKRRRRRIARQAAARLARLG